MNEYEALLNSYRAVLLPTMEHYLNSYVYCFSSRITASAVIRCLAVLRATVFLGRQVSGGRRAPGEYVTPQERCNEEKKIRFFDPGSLSLRFRHSRDLRYPGDHVQHRFGLDLLITCFRQPPPPYGCHTRTLTKRMGQNQPFISAGRVQPGYFLGKGFLLALQ